MIIQKATKRVQDSGIETDRVWDLFTINPLVNRNYLNQRVSNFVVFPSQLLLRSRTQRAIEAQFSIEVITYY